jgi:hypothetical protein
MIDLASLRLQIDGPVARLRFDHGKANEMGEAEIGDVERIAAELERGEVRVLISWSERLSPKGTPIFISGEIGRAHV